MRYRYLAIAGLIAVAIVAIAFWTSRTTPPPFSSSVGTTPIPRVAAPPGTKWNLEFNVEFDGASLDTSKLTPCFDWNFGQCTSSFNSGKEHYLPSQVQIANGVASLIAEPLTPPRSDSACYNGVCTYRSGLLSTARPDESSPYLYSFTYGYVEARLKLPSTPGMFAAFWMVPANPSHEYSSEIDIVENLGGKPDVIYQTYHYNGRQASYKVNDLSTENNGSCAKADYSANFHTYGVNWQPDHISFYIDGNLCGRMEASEPGIISDEPMQLVLNLMVDNSWAHDAKLVLPSQTVRDHLDVDYVRVWRAH